MLSSQSFEGFFDRESLELVSSSECVVLDQK